MHSEKSAISLSWKKLPYQPRLARNQFQVSNLDPTHASLRSTTSIMITTSNSSVKRSGTPNQFADRVGRNVARRMSIGRENYQRSIIPILSDTSRFSGGTNAGDFQ
jgi:hypothetical protein